ncbi:lipoyltransferase 1, mitochondrial-like [Coccinella septempunctata]|uniref:lipoyltransferase 1, mitochondrial-like n=1 Tax=Coccinella septempunctata TaxID=41139 RepID=UPI001D08AA7F|nr:lipoyltransferase 1, mitochondrial-like [Coccinella septempunctata]XP_044765298.1 lipoyltransferase 1, mitochondrial-like [Coccinella septempunctata]
MALFQRAICVYKTASFLRTVGRNLSTEPSIKKSVFISQSKDIYANLALQDWICKNIDMTDHHICMLWQNDPCVTIGKTSNPWCEANMADLPKITDGGVKLARQNSDGPSTYQDQGSLNITFFSQKDRLCEIYDMEILARAIFREFSLKLDIVQNELKLRGNYSISGTTKKVNENNAYHHCNLLVRVNKVDRMRSLTKQEIGIQQRNNEYENSKVMNLCEENPNVSVKKLVKAIGWEYMRTHASVVKDGGDQLANEQKGFQLVNPTDSWFPGIAKIRTEMARWEWLYGQTPDFKVNRTLCIPGNLGNEEGCSDLSMEITVSGGIIKDTTLSVPPSLANSGISGVINTVTTTLIGRRFTPDLIENLQQSIKNLGDDKMASAAYAPRKIMTSF